MLVKRNRIVKVISIAVGLSIAIAWLFASFQQEKLEGVTDSSLSTFELTIESTVESAVESTAFIMPTPNYNTSPEALFNTGNDIRLRREPRKCTKPYCSLRYIPSPLLSATEKVVQWNAVSSNHSLKIVKQNHLSKRSNRAWVTMITGSDYHYIASNFVLAQSLRNHKTKYPIVVYVWTIER